MSDVIAARAELYERGDHSITCTADYVAGCALDSTVIEAHAGCLAVTGARFFPEGRFDFSDHAEASTVAVIEAFDVDGETVIDIIAWPIAEPTSVASMFGRAAVVGAPAVMNPATYAFGRPLQVHRTVLDWLRLGCDGAAIVLPRAAARFLLDAPGCIAGQDVAHAHELLDLVDSMLERVRVVAAV